MKCFAGSTSYRILIKVLHAGHYQSAHKNYSRNHSWKARQPRFKMLATFILLALLRSSTKEAEARATLNVAIGLRSGDPNAERRDDESRAWQLVLEKQ
jgi:hypothetical protein